MSVLTFKHVMDGRIRLKISQVKKNPEEAKRVSLILDSLQGIQSVEVNELTGSVLIHFDEELLTLNQILNHLHQHKVFEMIEDNRMEQNTSVQTIAGQRHTSNEVLKTIVFKALEIAAERAIVALL